MMKYVNIYQRGNVDISSGKSRQPKPRPGFLACLRNRDHPHRYTDAKWKQESQNQRFPAFLKCIVISCYFPFISHLFPIYFPFISIKYPKVLYVVTLLPSGGAQGGPRGSGARGARAAFDAPHAAREVGFGDGKMG